MSDQHQRRSDLGIKYSLSLRLQYQSTDQEEIFALQARKIKPYWFLNTTVGLCVMSFNSAGVDGHRETETRGTVAPDQRILRRKCFCFCYFILMLFNLHFHVYKPWSFPIRFIKG